MCFSPLGVSLFEPVREDGTATHVFGAVLSVLRSRTVRWGSAFVLFGVGALLLGWTWFWSMTLESECRVVDVPRLDIDDFLALRARKTAYQTSRDTTPWLILHPRELTFLMAEHRGMSFEVTANESIADFKIGVPVDGGCYNIRLQGDVAVRDGVMTAKPSLLQVGGYDVTWLSRFWTVRLTPDDVHDEDLAHRLSNIRALKINNGEIYLRLKDRAANWSFQSK